jgi:hypothetical protein
MGWVPDRNGTLDTILYVERQRQQEEKVERQKALLTPTPRRRAGNRRNPWTADSPAPC